MIESIPRLNVRGKFRELGASGFVKLWSDEVLLRLRRARFPLDQLQRKLIERGSLLKEPASDQAIDSLGARMELEIPASLRDLYRATNGMYSYIDYASESLALLPVESVRWLHDQDPVLVRDWVRIQNDRPPDAAYFIYGEKQDVVVIRAEYMQRMLSLGPLIDGGALCLNTFIRFPSGELEAWDFSVKHPGARRYQSLGEMLEDRVESDCWLLDEWSAMHG